ncbi:hypothetical protein HIM_03283 [Hirsutella minnesotensis 3608]|nr:hypothetical protein HIM_03283 [Hirsutella minnesotensis 3608]
MTWSRDWLPTSLLVAGLRHPSRSRNHSFTSITLSPSVASRRSFVPRRSLRHTSDAVTSYRPSRHLEPGCLVTKRLPLDHPERPYFPEICLNTKKVRVPSAASYPAPFMASRAGGRRMQLRRHSPSFNDAPSKDQSLAVAARLRRDLGDRNVAVIAIVAIVGLLTVLAISLVAFAKRRRRRQYQGQKSNIPTQDVAENMLSVWQADSHTSERQEPRRNHESSSRSNRVNERRVMSVSHGTSRSGPGNNTSGINANGRASVDAAVDRSTSVRSVMTLPPYRCKASNNEQVLGREGERDGIDVIVDLPTAEDVEALREEEMETLYQIRTARRRQVAEREELRRQRSEARRRNDSEALIGIRARQRAASSTGELEDLRREVTRIQENRQRSVSRVSYADLGVAHLNGTRIRANSNESERMGLLSDAASIAVSTQSGAPSSALHQRHQSVVSLVSDDSEALTFNSARSRRASTSEVNSHADQNLRNRSSLELVEVDLGDETIPPPDYHVVSTYRDDVIDIPLNEPPPDYPGHGGTQPRRAEFGADLAFTGSNPTSLDSTQNDATTGSGRRASIIPQLPSLRISNLPAIVIVPSSARSPQC